MLSAISNFIFGAEKAPPAETPVEYDMKEDDEWMLVDVSGDKENSTPESTIEQDKNCDDPQEDDENNSVANDEDTFEYLPYIPLPSVKDATKLSFLKIATCVPPMMALYTDCTRTYQPSITEYADQLMNSNKMDVASTQQCRMRFMARAVMRLKGTKVLYDVIGSTTAEDLFLKLKDIVGSRENNCNNTLPATEVKPDEVPNLGPVSVENKTTAKLSKKEYLQEIQDLIPIQQAKEYQSKKYIKKAQLTRRNRVCMYESSNKNRHRRDLWQHHSGANNNRKSQ